MHGWLLDRSNACQLIYLITVVCVGVNITHLFCVEKLVSLCFVLLVERWCWHIGVTSSASLWKLSVTVTWIHLAPLYTCLSVRWETGGERGMKSQYKYKWFRKFTVSMSVIDRIRAFAVNLLGNDYYLECHIINTPQVWLIHWIKG